MGRAFTKNVSNLIRWPAGTIGSRLSGATAASVSAWVRVTGSLTGATNDNRILSIQNDTVAGLVLMVAGGVVRVGGRSVSSDGFQAVNGGTTVSGMSAWMHVGGVLLYSQDAMRVYLNGRLDGSGAVTFGNNAYTHTTGAGLDYVGGSAAISTGEQFPGDIADLAIWRGDIGHSGFQALAAGATPQSIASDSLIAYVVPSYTADLVDTARGAVALALVGSVPLAGGPPLLVAPVERRIFRKPPYGSSALPWLYRQHTHTIGAGFVRSA